MSTGAVQIWKFIREAAGLLQHLYSSTPETKGLRVGAWDESRVASQANFQVWLMPADFGGQGVLGPVLSGPPTAVVDKCKEPRRWGLPRAESMHDMPVPPLLGQEPVS